MFALLNISDIVEQEIEVYGGTDDYYTEQAVEDIVSTFFSSDIVFNEVSERRCRLIQDAIDGKRIREVKNSVLIRTNNITNMTSMVSYFRENLHINLAQLDNTLTILENVSLYELYKMRHFIDGPLYYITLGIDNLTKFRNLLTKKLISYSTDKKFMASGCNYKVVVNVSDNVPKLSELNDVTRIEHYLRVMKNFESKLILDGYKPVLGSACGIHGLRLSFFCNELPNMNVLKLYRLDNIKIAIPHDRRIVKDDTEFEKVYEYFI